MCKYYNYYLFLGSLFLRAGGVPPEESAIHQRSGSVWDVPQLLIEHRNGPATP